MASTPQFTGTPKVGIAALSAANTGRDGTGTIVSVLAAGANGSRIDKVVVKATVTTTAGRQRNFFSVKISRRFYRDGSLSLSG